MGLASRLPLRQTIGVAIGEDAIVAVRASSALGPDLREKLIVPMEGDTADDGLRRALGEMAKRKTWRGLPFAIGLPPLNLFFSTRPIKSIHHNASPQVMLHEVLRSSSLNIDDMEIAMRKVQPAKQALASLVACRRKYLAPITAALGESHVGPEQVEPSPCALLRLAVMRHKTPRSAATALRVFLGEKQGIALLTARDVPLMWRAFDVHPDRLAGTLRAVYRSIVSLGRFLGVDETPGAVLVHGRPDLGSVHEGQDWKGETVKTVRFDDPSYDPEAIALGLAIGCQPTFEGFNLAPSLRPSVKLARQVPWVMIGVEALVLAGVSFFMNDTAHDVETAIATLRMEQDSFEWVRKRTLKELTEERKQLDNRVSALAKFLGPSVSWTSCAREVSACLPATVNLTSLNGVAEYTADAAKTAGVKKSLTLQVETTIPETGIIPREVDEFVGGLRKQTTLKKALPIIEMGGLTYNSGNRNSEPKATFTVTCKPPEASKKAQPKGG